jgi:hypothetical protein
VTTGLARLRARRRFWALLALPALWLHLLIPAGFMPANDAPLSLQICPEGFPAGLLAHAGHHHHHGGGEHGGGEHCTFGAAGGNGPPSQQAPPLAHPYPVLVAAEPCGAPRLFVRLVYLPQARGPPPFV